MKKRVFLIGVMLMTLMFAPSIFAQGNTEASSGKKQLVFGFSHSNLSNEFMVTLQKGITDKCKELGIKVICNNPEMDANKQMSEVESFIAQGVDLIIIDPVDTDASGPAIDKARAAGIPIVSVNSVTTNPSDAFIGSADEEASQIAINYLAKRLNGKGNIAMIHGNPGQSAEVKRSSGAYEMLKKYPDLKLITEETANWSREKAMSLTEDWIQKYGNSLNAIFAQNDEMAMGCVQAAENEGIKDKLIIIGVDAIPDALQAIKEGRDDATVFQDAYGQGQEVVEIAYELINGKKVSKETFIPFQLVTKDNVDKFISK
ncbi:sugar ABC transporter substrate-binding protein [uncultured Sphaerochaeta sp.]|uniref:sugar ABC transporter substrate-binding protein n=1 Tax=uncultured Sphaerochaeta sp. TaxID=886478 RepID=UPI002A0A8B1C|nr:sugar ABC transporter substrate-binding protein [uncultured Sphaerochaeta sp.]